MHSVCMARPDNRVRLVAGRDRARSEVGGEAEAAVDRDEPFESGHRRMECLLSAIIGNARLLKLETTDLPESAARRIDIIADTAQRISALLHCPQGESVSSGDSNPDTYR